MKKNIVIAGASSGLGNALAREYLKQGHQVFGCGRTPKVPIGSVHYTPVDLTESAEVASWLADIVSGHNHIDVCINCAGSLASGKLLWEYDADEVRSMIDTNIIGLCNLIRPVIPQMKRQGYGRFITMASNPAGYPPQGLGLYTLCKSAVEQLIALLGEELPEEVTVVALYPGMINTPMLQKSVGKEAAESYQKPEQWAERAGNALIHISKEHQGRHLGVEELLG